jgi:hypothetical protein
MTVTRRPVPALVAVFAGVMAACASASSSGNRAAACSLAPGDTVYLRAGVIYRECAVDKRARAIDHSARPDFRPSSPVPGGQACYRADVEFVVDTTGLPEAETARVLRTNNPSYAESVLRALALWRYQPASLNGSPVRQIVQEKSAMGVAVVVVPAGQIPRPPQRSPTC